MRGGVVDGGGSRNQAAVGVAERVAERVGLRHGPRHFDGVAVDDDGDEILEAVAGFLVATNEDVVVVAGEERFFFATGGLRFFKVAMRDYQPW